MESFNYDIRLFHCSNKGRFNKKHISTSVYSAFTKDYSIFIPCVDHPGYAIKIRFFGIWILHKFDPYMKAYSSYIESWNDWTNPWEATELVS